jgi:hypothetical protein
MKIIYPNGRLEVTVPAAGSIAVATYGLGSAKVYRELGFPNYPEALSLLGSVANTETVYGAYASGATIIIEAGADPVYYDVGVSPRVTFTAGNERKQTDPSTLNATGTLTAAMILDGIVTSSTASAVTATLDTGAIMDDATSMEIGDAFEWVAINTGGSNAFTVTAAASGHTIVGAGAVAANTSGRFRTRKTAADTFVTYRV